MIVPTNKHIKIQKNETKTEAYRRGKKSFDASVCPNCDADLTIRSGNAGITKTCPVCQFVGYDCS